MSKELLLKDGTLVVTIDKPTYEKTKRVMVEASGDVLGTLFYQDDGTRPTGKWITTNMKGIYRCSNCRMLSYLRSYNYCQNCGSKMEVDE